MTVDSQGFVQGWNNFVSNTGTMAGNWVDFVLLGAGEGLAALRPGTGNCVCTVLLFLMGEWPGYVFYFPSEQKMTNENTHQKR